MVVSHWGFDQYDDSRYTPLIFAEYEFVARNMVGGFPYPQECPICGGHIWSPGEAPPGRKGWEEYDALGRYFRHMNESHPAYRRWLRKISRGYRLAVVAPILAIVAPAIVLYYFQIMSIDAARAVGLFATLPSIFVGVFIVWFFEARGTKRFHETWKEEHIGVTSLSSAP